MRSTVLQNPFKNGLPLLGTRALARILVRFLLACGFVFVGTNLPCSAVENAAAKFREDVQPILETYCYGCHGYGAREGNRSLDEFESDEAMVGNIELWSAVLKNVRAGVMPPSGEERPNE